MNSKLSNLFKQKIDSISNSISRKYLITYSIILLIPILLVYQTIIQYAEETIGNDIIEKNLSHTDLLAKRFNAELTDVVYQLQLILQQKDDESLDTERMFEGAKKTIANSSVFYAITLVDENKRILFEAPFRPEMEKPYYYQHPNFNALQWSLNYDISGITPNYSGKESATISIPVIIKNRKFKGALVADLNQKYLSEVLKENVSSMGGFGFIVDSNGRIIASADSKGIGDVYAYAEGMGHILKNPSRVIIENDQDNRNIITYQKMIGNWSVVTGISESIAFAPVKKLSAALTFGFASILLLALLYSGISMKNLLHPIVSLTHLSRDFRRGNSLEQIQSMKRFRSSDELGVLMQTITSMGLSNIKKQQMLEEKEKYLRDVMEGIPYAIVTIDPQGTITYFNKKFEKLTGLDRGYIVDRKLSELPIKRCEQDFVCLNILNSESSSKSEEKETYILDSAGNRRIIKVATSKFYNNLGEFVGVIAVGQDISQLKLLEEYAKQNEKMAMFGQITAGIAHEIKNPLAILSGASELLKDMLDRDAGKEKIGPLVLDICKVVERMTGITNRFLHFTKIKNEEFEFIQIERLLDELLHLLRINLEQTNVQLERNYEASGTGINGKYDRLMQAFLNLFLNSLDAMKNGGKLHVSTREIREEDSEWLIVTVEDTGIGIQIENMDWLFQPFHTTKEKGSGLGLTISREIIQEHFGDIQVESKVSEGTRMICKFPLIRQEKAG